MLNKNSLFIAFIFFACLHFSYGEDKVVIVDDVRANKMNIGNQSLSISSISVKSLNVIDGDIVISTTTGSRGVIYQDGTKQTTAFSGGVVSHASSHYSGGTDPLIGTLAISSITVSPSSTDGALVISTNVKITGGVTALSMNVSGGLTSGLFLAGNGTNVAPSYSFSGNTNTGLYRPEVDSLGLVTAGLDRIRINSSGNVGIGTTSPGQKLEIGGTDSRLLMNSANSNLIDFGIIGVAPPGANSAGQKIRLYGIGSVAAAQYAIGIEGGYMWFSNDQAVANTGYKFYNSVGAVNLCIQGDGNIGIGTTVPISKLEVMDGDIRISTTTGSRGIIFQDGSIGSSAKVLQSSATANSASTNVIGTYSTIPNMTITAPGAGDYIAYFSGTIFSPDVTVTPNVEVFVSLFINGTQVTNSERSFTIEDSLGNNTRFPIATQSFITVGSGNVEARWRCLGCLADGNDNLIIKARTLTLEKK